MRMRQRPEQSQRSALISPGEIESLKPLEASRFSKDEVSRKRPLAELTDEALVKILPQASLAKTVGEDLRFRVQREGKVPFIEGREKELAKGEVALIAERADSEAGGDPFVQLLLVESPNKRRLGIDFLRLQDSRRDFTDHVIGNYVDYLEVVAEHGAERADAVIEKGLSKTPRDYWLDEAKKGKPVYDYITQRDPTALRRHLAIISRYQQEGENGFDNAYKTMWESLSRDLAHSFPERFSRGPPAPFQDKPGLPLPVSRELRDRLYSFCKERGIKQIEGGALGLEQYRYYEKVWGMKRKRLSKDGRTAMKQLKEAQKIADRLIETGHELSKRHKRSELISRLYIGHIQFAPSMEAAVTGEGLMQQRPIIPMYKKL